MKVLISGAYNMENNVYMHDARHICDILDINQCNISVVENAHSTHKCPPNHGEHLELVTAALISQYLAIHLKIGHIKPAYSIQINIFADIYHCEFFSYDSHHVPYDLDNK